MTTKPSRRDFLRAAAIAGCGAAWPLALQDAAKRRIPARFVGDALERGHHWLEPDPVKLHVDRREQKGIVIVGAGVSGVVAAWRLQAASVEDFVVLELEDKAGGLARNGKMGSLTVPFGGVTMSVPDATTPPAVLRFLDAAGVDRVPKRFAPRAFESGAWGPSVLGSFAPPPIVFATGSRPSTEALDAVSVASFLGEGKATPEQISLATRWCLLRFGSRPGDLSAAAFLESVSRALLRREGRALVIPGGFASLLPPLLAKIGPRLLPGQVAVLVERAEGGALVRAANAVDATVTDFSARAVLLAVPPFIASKIAPKFKERDQGLALPATTPWLVTAVMVDRWPKGFDPEAPFHQCADERATLILHMGIPPEAVIVGHRPFPASGTMPGRMFLRDLDVEAARDWALRELEQPFPDLAAVASKVELLRIGHGPVRPAPGYMTEVAPKLRAPLPPMWRCGADYAGLPSVESAIVEGVRGAEEILKSLGKLNESWL